MNRRMPLIAASLAAVCITGSGCGNAPIQNLHWDIGVACEPGTEATLLRADGVGTSDTGQVFIGCESPSGSRPYAPEAMDVAGSGIAPQLILGCANVVTISYEPATGEKQSVSLTTSSGEVALSGIAALTNVHIRHSVNGCSKSLTT
jgi:hypothetical protein